MMAAKDVLAFFITWNVYGTYLQGDPRGWWKRGAGLQQPQPLLQEWHADRLKYPILLLNEQQREAVENELDRLADACGWYLWARNARSNHVHTVVTAYDRSAQSVRDKMKANCTRMIRERWPQFQDRPVWTANGHCVWIKSQADLEAVIDYVNIAQDLMHLRFPLNRGR